MHQFLMDHGFEGHRGGGGGFFFLLTLLLLGAATILFVRAIGRRRGWERYRPDSRRILDERFARGEIDRAEFEHRRAVLDGDEVIPPAPATTAPTPPPPTTPPASSDGGDTEES